MHFGRHANEGAIAPLRPPDYATGCYIHYYRIRILDLAMVTLVSTDTLGYTNFLHIVGNLVNFVVRC